MNATITPATKYRTVLEAVKAGAAVTQSDLDEANEYAKRAKRARIKDAKIIEIIEPAPVVEPEPVAEVVAVVKKKKCVGNADHKNESEHTCDRDAKANDRCMKHYIQVYRMDEANRKRANEASNRYVARQRAKAEAKANA